jgi:hypothetical protein
MGWESNSVDQRGLAGSISATSQLTGAERSAISRWGAELRAGKREAAGKKRGAETGEEGRGREAASRRPRTYHRSRSDGQNTGVVSFRDQGEHEDVARAAP